MSISKNQPMRSAEIDLIEAFNDAELENIPSLIEEVNTLESTVGDADSGLVKYVSDLRTTVGNDSYGLVKSVDDLENTVGDDTDGLVKDVTDIGTDVSILQGVVGDDSSGLVKNVDTLQNTILKIECGEVTFSSIAAGSSVEELVTFTNEFDVTPIVALTRLGAGVSTYDEEITVATRTTEQIGIKVFNRGASAITPKIGWIATTIGKHTA